MEAVQFAFGMKFGPAPVPKMNRVETCVLRLMSMLPLNLYVHEANIAFLTFQSMVISTTSDILTLMGIAKR